MHSKARERDIVRAEDDRSIAENEARIFGAHGRLRILMPERAEKRIRLAGHGLPAA